MAILLNRIAQQLATETDPRLRAEAIAKRAAYLARIGRFQESRQEITEVRQMFGDGQSARVTILLMIAEALLTYYEQLDGKVALDRILRAELLANATRDRPLAALSSSWKAFLAFELSDVRSLGRALKAAFENATEQDHAAMSRSAVVLHICFELCGDDQRSQHWFNEGRRHAVAEGDQATLDALQHNRASFRAARIAAEWCKGQSNALLVARAKQEASSARNLQTLTQIAALKHYIDLCDARLLIILEQWQAALGLLEVVRSAGPFPKSHINEHLLDLETAYCQVRQASATQQSEISVPDPAHLEALDVDDQLWGARLTFELAKLGYGKPDEAEDRLNRSLRQYELWLGEWASAIEESGVK